MKFLIIITNFLIFKLIFAQNLPPLPEEWELAIGDYIQGIKKESWLSNYKFLAKPRVYPGKNWKVRVEATWNGPSLLDPALLNYLSLVFDPIDKNVLQFWSGKQILNVKEYNHTTKRIIFTPKFSTILMKASTSRLGVYNGMQFLLKVGDEVLPGMNVLVNTRVSRDVEVTCSDGIYCNGDERYVKIGKAFKCMKAKFGPCDDPDGDPCKSYECIESERECKSYPKGGSSCRSCNSTNDNSAELCKQQNYECGWNSDKTLYCGVCSV
ncbi:unnamed protein product [Brachionus calyciflorus]|uniref:Uncharacterized protein n=1 Tax=Brachionus calyciflorus TaxID=104777 RepID=A0A814GB46_9BILA|nr:unnamed protein product [Brachionus calyciflorus]